MVKTRWLLLAVVALLPTQLYAHGGEDPVEELRRYDRSIDQQLERLEQLPGDSAERMEVIEEQVGLLLRKTTLLRNMMAADYPHVQEKMSKYKMDYLEALDQSLVQMRALLKQFDAMVEQ